MRACAGSFCFGNGGGNGTPKHIRPEVRQMPCPNEFRRNGGFSLILILIIAVIAALTGADQLIKLWAIDNLKDQPPRSFLPIGSLDWMHLRYLENDGAAFSMLSGSRLLLIVFPVVMIALCLYMLHRLGRTHRWLYAALPLIAAGGLGNLIDRIFRGGRVVDYFDFQLARFAVFNFADVCVTVGVAVMFIGILFLEKELPDAKKLKNAERVPYARLAAPLAEAGELPEAGALPEAGVRAEAGVLPESGSAETAEKDHA